MNSKVHRQVTKLLEQHFGEEARLATRVHELNAVTKQALESSGLRALSQDDLDRLGPLSDSVTSGTEQLKRSREKLLSKVNVLLGSNHRNISSVLDSLSEFDRVRLDEIRRALLEQCTEAQTELVQNQATLVYSYDFNRRYVAGITQTEAETLNYGRDGAVNEVHPGKLYRKSC